MKSLPAKVVRSMRDIDHEQSEGGLYALPDRCSKGKWPAAHHHIFGGTFKELDLFSRIGMRSREQGSNRIAFSTEELSGSAQFIDIALTKIRPYGNRFQLDRHHGKKWEDCSSNLKKSVSRFLKGSRNVRTIETSLLVALVFTDNEKHAADLIEPSTNESFLRRYDLSLANETWADPHGRGIWTSVLCWALQPRKTSS